MRKNVWLWLALCLLGTLGTACAAREVAGEGDFRPLVYTSFHAMYDFTRSIAGEAVAVAVLLPPGSDPHHWEPSAGDMVRLARADAFIYHGAGMEYFIETIRAGGSEGLAFVAASDGLSAYLGGGCCGPGETDPHLWLNPLHALHAKENIARVLAEIDPANAAVFEANFQEAAQRLRDLDARFRAAAANFVRRDLVVTHAGFGHLSAAYGLHQVAIEGPHAHSEPSPARMAEIINFVRDNGVTTVFYDKSPALAQIVAAETGARIARLDTFEGITTEDYFTVMERNLQALVEALT